jgi:hypothetical protein
VPETRYVGPFQTWEIVVNGSTVPYLTARPKRDGAVHVTLDHRFGLDLSEEEAEKVVPFLADVIAVALGYTCHPCPEVPEPPLRRAATRMHSLDDSPAGAELD